MKITLKTEQFGFCGQEKFVMFTSNPEEEVMRALFDITRELPFNTFQGPLTTEKTLAKVLGEQLHKKGIYKTLNPKFLNEKASVSLRVVRSPRKQKGTYRLDYRIDLKD